MSVQQLKKIRISDAEYEDIKTKVLARILRHSNPKLVYVIGSMRERIVSPESDFDVVLVYETVAEIRDAQKKILGQPPLDTAYAIEYIFLTLSRFERLKNLGGIPHEACHNGERIHG